MVYFAGSPMDGGITNSEVITLFNVYVLFLIISGVLMLGLAFSKVGQTGSRVLRGVLGAGFLGYGLYLLLFFQGGHYVMFFYAFVVPVLIIVQFFRERSAVKARQAAAQRQMAAQQAAQQSAAQQAPRQ